MKRQMIASYLRSWFRKRGVITYRIKWQRPPHTSRCFSCRAADLLSASNRVHICRAKSFEDMQSLLFRSSLVFSSSLKDWSRLRLDPGWTNFRFFSGFFGRKWRLDNTHFSFPIKSTFLTVVRGPNVDASEEVFWKWYPAFLQSFLDYSKSPDLQIVN